MLQQKRLKQNNGFSHHYYGPMWNGLADVIISFVNLIQTLMRIIIICTTFSAPKRPVRFIPFAVKYTIVKDRKEQRIEKKK